MPSSDRQRPPPDGFADQLRAVLDAWASQSPPTRLTVAFSGGLDSTVLLDAIMKLGLPAEVRAVHVDHGLQPQSAEWSAHCAAVAARLGVDFMGVRAAVDAASAHGLEAAARDARYRALGDLLAPGEWLLTAHHADDQLETLLLRLLRGTGVRGLRGIIEFGPFAAGWLVRPLLRFTREQLRAEADARKLVWVEDPSNRELRQDRNYLRREVLPALRSRWPRAAEQALRLAAQMSEAEQLLEALAAEDARELTSPAHLPRAVLAPLEPARQRNLLRYLLRLLHLGTPSARKLEELRHALLSAHAESHACVRWSGGEGRVFRAALHLLAPLPQASSPGFSTRIAVGAGWSGPEGQVALEPAGAEGGLPQSWVEQGLTLRFRQGGERIRPRGRAHHHSLKHVFQECGVFPWMRERVPLLYRDRELVAVGDFEVSAAVDTVDTAEPRWRVRWTDHPATRAP